ncbi:MAG: RluA family pseudouridine synthase [Acidimicrobiia bacterium]|nr:RluA family pseudouridine synthase [Acidimicrobiia bacterium]
MISTEVGPALDGERVDRVVAMLTGVSRSRSAELVAEGAVRLGGRVVATRSARVREGQVVEVLWSGDDAPGGPAADPSVPLQVVYGDDDVIVLDKPAGLVVHPGAGHADGTLVNGLLARYPDLAAIGQPGRPGIVHRLDRGTSGLLVVARSSLAYEGLVGALAAHEVERSYQALAWGAFEAASGLVDAPVGRSASEPTRMAVRHDGKPARTAYRVERHFDQPVSVTLLGCSLETGRTHQVRVHLQAIGHPVVGDQRYGGRRSGLVLDRPWLHARRLAFEHPVTGAPLSFESPLPADLATVLEALEVAAQPTVTPSG